MWEIFNRHIVNKKKHCNSTLKRFLITLNVSLRHELETIEFLQQTTFYEKKIPDLFQFIGQLQTIVRDPQSHYCEQSTDIIKKYWEKHIKTKSRLIMTFKITERCLRIRISVELSKPDEVIFLKFFTKLNAYIRGKTYWHIWLFTTHQKADISQKHIIMA